MQEGPRLCLGLPLGRALGAPWIASWMRLGLLLQAWGLFVGFGTFPNVVGFPSWLRAAPYKGSPDCAFSGAPHMGRALDCLLGAPWGGSVFANSAKNRGALLTAPFMGRQGPRALAWGAPLDAPWLAPWIALGPRGRRGEPRAWGLFWERRFAFPNVVGFVPNVVELGTFPNVAS